MGNINKNQSTSSEPRVEKVRFPWDWVILIPFWLVFAYFSVAFPHKTFHLSSLEVPMTPLLLFFACCLILLVYSTVIEKEDFGSALIVSLLANFLVILPFPIAWGLLWFYDVNPLPSFLAVLIVPAISLPYDLRDWSESRKKKTSKAVEGIRSMSRPFKLIGFYVSGLFFGYGTIISLSYLFCYFTNQPLDMFARTNPAVILLGGATIMAGILALLKSSR